MTNAWRIERHCSFGDHIPAGHGFPPLPVPRTRPAMRPSPGTLAAIANTRPPSPSAGDEARDSDAVQLRSTADDFA